MHPSLSSVSFSVFLSSFGFFLPPVFYPSPISFLPTHLPRSDVAKVSPWPGNAMGHANEFGTF